MTRHTLSCTVENDVKYSEGELDRSSVGSVAQFPGLISG